MSVRTIFSTILLIIIAAGAAGQSPAYNKLIQQAEELAKSKHYKESAAAYSKAFATMGGKAAPDDRYNAACMWALSGSTDSAFYHLNYLATKGKFKDYKHLLEDTDLESLHPDKQWAAICQQVQQNKETASAKLNKPLVAQLETILDNDQKYRMALDSVGQKYGQDSKELDDLWKAIALHDSLNEIEVIAILEKYGWPGIDMVGEEGSETVFLVIQHADIKIQDKYLPMVREAVKKGAVKPGSLAILEDRVALRHGGKQKYGSQLAGDGNGPFVLPMVDPDNVDKRRATVGLGPLSEYLQNWGLTWDAATYKRQLPEIEAGILAGKTPEYQKLVQKANDLYTAKQYKESAGTYRKAFTIIGGKAAPDDRYNMACCWALAGSKDSAMYQLNYLATKANYKNHKHLLEDTDLESLHTDKRWAALCKQVKQNSDKAEAKHK